MVRSRRAGPGKLASSPCALAACISLQYTASNLLPVHVQGAPSGHSSYIDTSTSIDIVPKRLASSSRYSLSFLPLRGLRSPPGCGK